MSDNDTQQNRSRLKNEKGEHQDKDGEWEPSGERRRIVHLQRQWPELRGARQGRTSCGSKLQKPCRYPAVTLQGLDVALPVRFEA
jgi:hypothetical protein